MKVIGWIYRTCDICKVKSNCERVLLDDTALSICSICKTFKEGDDYVNRRHDKTISKQ